MKKIIISVPDEFGADDSIEVGVREYIEEFYGEGAAAEDGTIKMISVEVVKNPDG